MSVLYCLTVCTELSPRGGGTCVLQSSKFNGPRTVALARRARRDLVHDGLAATRYLGVWSVTECTRAAGLQNIDRGVFSCAQKKRLSPRLSDARPTQFPPPPPHSTQTAPRPLLDPLAIFFDPNCEDPLGWLRRCCGACNYAPRRSGAHGRTRAQRDPSHCPSRLRRSPEVPAPKPSLSLAPKRREGTW